MKVVLQRVTTASVTIMGSVNAAIGSGLLLLVGIEEADALEDVDWLAQKIVNLRVFNDAAGVPNVSLKDAGGDILLISQFTLHADTKKGNRPSYIKASKPTVAVPLYEGLIAKLELALGKKIGTGIFGADMKVALVNDGPLTIIIDSKNR